jgi:rhodanese-related sulfurtransferase
MPPFNLSSLSGTLGYDLIFLAIGMGFGAALELTGFGDTRKIAAQFYFRKADMTVLKAMFTAIIVAATLIFLTSALGLLDFNKLWVNPTYLWPGIIGGLLVGGGLMIGGFCPGTSLVAAGTLKIDGMVFLLGAATGIFIFGETVHSLSGFFYSSFMGRFILPELLGLSTGTTLVLLVLMALAMFAGAEVVESYYKRTDLQKSISLKPGHRATVLGAAGLLALAVLTAAIGQPSAEDRWKRIASEGDRQLRDREVFAHPREVVDLKKNTSLVVSVLDLRDERDYNLFHIAGSKRLSVTSLQDPATIKPLLADADNVIHFLVSNGDELSATAWKLLKAQGVLNLYVVDGGINHWLDVFPPAACIAEKRSPAAPASGDALNYRFLLAVGDRIPQAHPDYAGKDPLPSCAVTEPTDRHVTHAASEYTKKVKLQKKSATKGGCG